MDTQPIDGDGALKPNAYVLRTVPDDSSASSMVQVQIATPFSNEAHRVPSGTSRLTQQVRAVADELRQNDAQSAAHRLQLAAEHVATLAPEAIYAFVDPSRVWEELENVRGKKTRQLSAIRNALALLPLLLTWFAFAWASTEYQQYIAKYPAKITTPFLIIWQEGFGHQTGFTFSTTAILDFFCLAAVLLVTVWAQIEDGRASQFARTIGQQVDECVAELVATARAGVIVPNNANPADWANVVQATITQSLSDMQAAVLQIAQEAVTVVQAVGASNHALIDAEMRPLVNKFGRGVTDLKHSLDGYNTSLSTIQTTIQQLGGAANTLSSATQSMAGYVSSYSATATSIDDNLKKLRDAQQQFVATVAGSAHDMTRAADSVEKLAVQINQDMVDNLEQASRNLANVNLQVQQTAADLGRASRLLASAAATLDVAAANAVRARLGLLGWVFGRSRTTRP